MFLRNVILLSLLGASSALHSAEFPPGLVSAELASEFAGGTILQGLPADFPALLVPARLDLHLVGSLQRNEYSQQLLLRSSLGREELNEGLLTALAMQGWVDVNSLALPGIALRLCHDQHGEMSISGTTVSGGTRLQVTRSVYPPQFTRPPCAEQQAQTRANAARRSLYESLVPVLEVPEATVESPRPAYIRGSSTSFSSNSFQIEREGGIEVPDTNAAEVHEHFAAQMRAQGWASDSSNAGEISAASVWTRSITHADATTTEQIFAALTILRGAADYYGVTLVLRSAPAEGSGSGIVGISPI